MVPEPHGMNFEARDKAALLGVLRSIKIGRPVGSTGTKREYAESYAVAHLLSALAGASSLLMYPLELIHREPPQDRPGFLLTMSGKKVGIEHTDARSSNETRKDVLRVKERIGGEAYLMKPVKLGEPKRSAKELRNEIKADDSGGWGDPDRVAQQWAEVMLYFIERKEHTLHAGGFTRYDEDWLLVRDAWPFPRVRWEDACRDLFSRIRDRGRKLQFHRVFVVTCEDEGPVCEISESGYPLYPRCDLWAK